MLQSVSSFLLLLLFSSCRHATEPPPPVHVSSVQLTLEDALTTEVWLKLAFTDSTGAREFSLSRNDQTIFTGRLNARDTTLVDTTVQPSTSYTYKAFRLSGSSQTDYSDALPVTTMPVTSHSFNFSVDTLGSGGSSVLRDVAIISDNDVWCVGQIYVDTSFYNAAHWNGRGWELKRITVNYKGNVVVPQLEGIFTFSPTDIWCIGSFPIHGDGTTWTLYHLQDMGISASVSKAWGTNSSNIFFVGVSGSVVHYDGGSWQKMESGTTLNLYDIWGTSSSDVWASGHCGYLSWCNGGSNGDAILLHFDGTVWRTADYVHYTAPPDSIGITSPVYTVWGYNQNNYAAVGNGIVHWRGEQLLPHTISSWSSMTNRYGFPMRIRGSAPNNIVVVGDVGFIMHYNGKEWYRYPFMETNPDLRFFSVAVSNMKIFAVGYTVATHQAFVLRGTRQ